MRLRDVSEALQHELPALFECTEVSRGSVRVRTPLLYPDGGLIDVFVIERSGEYLVTDHGDSLGWLGMQTASDRLTANQNEMIDDICLGLGIRRDRGQLTATCEKPFAIADAIHRLGQAALRVADVNFTFRTRQVQSIGDEIETWLRSRSEQFRVERNVKRRGASGHDWTLDYSVSVQERTSLMFLLTASNPSTAWTRSTIVFAGFSDLREQALENGSVAHISLFDNTETTWRPDSVSLLGRVSTPVMWSERDQLAGMLANPVLPMAR